MSILQRHAIQRLLIAAGALWVAGCAQTRTAGISKDFPNEAAARAAALELGAESERMPERRTTSHRAWRVYSTPSEVIQTSGESDLHLSPVMPAVESATDRTVRISEAAHAVETVPVVDIPLTLVDEGTIRASAQAPRRGMLQQASSKKEQRRETKGLLIGMGAIKQGKHARHQDFGHDWPPIELRYKSHPMYVVEPPDELYIEALDLLPNRNVEGFRLVRQDGTISLGYYGQLHVSGLTLPEIEEKIRQRLGEFVNDPQVYVDVAYFNSKVYYILGQVTQTGRLPITGKETVLDAIVQAGGLTNFADRRRIYVARPSPGGGCDQILFVDYNSIQKGDTRTNFQLLPGDRVVVPATKGFGLSRLMDNVLPPVERVLNLFTLFRFAFTDSNNN